MLEQLKAKHEMVSQLYVDVGKDLDTELRAAGGNEEIVAKFKKFIMDGFPWATIEKKRTLITDFIDEQAKLLTFYEKNWGSWSAPPMQTIPNLLPLPRQTSTKGSATK